MKMYVIGIKRIKGDKSKAGNPYDMPAFLGLVPIEQVANVEKGFYITGKGHEVAEIPYAVDQIKDADIQSLPFSIEKPLLLDLHIDSVPRFGRFESVCVGFTQVHPLQKVA